MASRRLSESATKKQLSTFDISEFTSTEVKRQIVDGHRIAASKMTVDETLLQYVDQQKTQVYISNITVRYLYTDMPLPCLDQKKKRLTSLVAKMLSRHLKALRMVVVENLDAGVLNVIFQVVSHSDTAHTHVFAPAREANSEYSGYYYTAHRRDAAPEHDTWGWDGAISGVVVYPNLEKEHIPLMPEWSCQTSECAKRVNDTCSCHFNSAVNLHYIFLPRRGGVHDNRLSMRDRRGLSISTF
jgi:hypothetical protein